MANPNPEAGELQPLDPLVGMPISGSYQIEALLGEGGMGKVYAARHVRLPRRAAVKVLQPELARAPEVLKRFQREAEIASSLGSRHIVQVFDFGELAIGAPYILMELLEGKDLAQHLYENQRLGPGEVIGLFDQLVSGLATAHASGVVHRDIKPANIFLAREADGTEVLKILDFGLSKVRGMSTSLTGANAIGTPAYMSPEQLLASGEVDRRADVYALGVTLFELLTGTLPFDDPSVTRLCEHIINEAAPLASSRRPSLAGALDRVIARALTKDPAARYGSVTDLWADARPELQALAAMQQTDDALAVSPALGTGAATWNGKEPVGATFISGPTPRGSGEATAVERGKPRPPGITEPLAAPASSVRLESSRRRWPLVLAAAAVVAAGAWLCAQLAGPRPAPEAQQVALQPVVEHAVAPVPPPAMATPPAAPAIAHPPPQPAPAATAEPARAPKPPRHAAHAKPRSGDALLGADTLDN